MPKAPKTHHHSRSQPYTTTSATSTTATTSMAPQLASLTATVDRRMTGVWLPEHDEQLILARQQGRNWAPIAQNFPGKSANACRKRHERLVQKRNSTKGWDDAKMEALGKAYMDIREDMWKMLANRLGGEKWETVEAKCMEHGFKNIQTVSRRANRPPSTQRQVETGLTDASPHPYQRSKVQTPESEGFNDTAIGHENDHYAAHSRSSPLQPPHSSYSPSIIPHSRQSPQQLPPLSDSPPFAYHNQPSPRQPQQHQPYSSSTSYRSDRTQSNASSSYGGFTGVNPTITAGAQSSPMHPQDLKLPSISTTFGPEGIPGISHNMRGPGYIPATTH